jgi:hypothetical protein
MRIIIVFCFLLSACGEEVKLSLTDEISYKKSLLLISTKIDDEDKPILEYVVTKYKPTFPMSDADTIRLSFIHNKSGTDLLKLGNAQLESFRVKKINELEEAIKSRSKILLKNIESLKNVELVLIGNKELEKFNKIEECSFRIACSEDVRFEIDVRNSSDEYITSSAFLLITKNKIGYLVSHSPIPPKRESTISLKLTELASLSNSGYEIVEIYQYLENRDTYQKQIQDTSQDTSQEVKLIPVTAYFINSTTYDDIQKLKLIEKQLEDEWKVTQLEDEWNKPDRNGISAGYFVRPVSRASEKIDSLYFSSRKSIQIYWLLGSLKVDTSNLAKLERKKNSDLAGDFINGKLFFE